jgi:hypothetical protein
VTGTQSHHVCVSATAEYHCIGGKGTAKDNYHAETRSSWIDEVDIDDYGVVTVTAGNIVASEHVRGDGLLVGTLTIDLEIADCLVGESEADARERLREELPNETTVTFNSAPLDIRVT